MWYKNAVFYEVNVRAFADGNGDGHGDLIGLTQRLDYLKDLGVDCLWLMPIFQSPLRDDGYDISDYYTIQPIFGTVEDFKRLLDEAHKRGIRVLTDLVIGKPVDEAMSIHETFLTLMQGKGTVEPDEDVLEDGIAFAGVAKFPARVKCALLSWMAWKDATARSLEETHG